MQAIFHRDEMIGEAGAVSLRPTLWEPIEIHRRTGRTARSRNKEKYIVEIAESDAVLRMAHQLVRERYSARGYCVSNRVPNREHETTVVVFDRNAISGTATLRVDSPSGIGADTIFKNEVDLLRDKGAKICEITRFAVSRGADSTLVLSAVYHFLYIVMLSLRRCTHLFIEVNPRHRRFYEKFGFECRSDVRLNPRVNAPAFLMQATTDYLASQVYHVSDDVTFPRFYTAQEEHAIRMRFATLQPHTVPVHSELDMLTQM